MQKSKIWIFVALLKNIELKWQEVNIQLKYKLFVATWTLKFKYYKW